MRHVPQAVAQPAQIDQAPCQQGGHSGTGGEAGQDYGGGS